MTRRVRVPLLFMLVALVLSLSGCSTFCRSHCEASFAELVGTGTVQINIPVTKDGSGRLVLGAVADANISASGKDGAPTAVYWYLDLGADVELSEIESAVLKVKNGSGNKQVYPSSFNIPQGSRIRPSGALRGAPIYNGQGEAIWEYSVTVNLTTGQAPLFVDPKIIIRR